MDMASPHQSATAYHQASLRFAMGGHSPENPLHSWLILYSLPDDYFLNNANHVV
jgi:hypothetical protein